MTFDRAKFERGRRELYVDATDMTIESDNMPLTLEQARHLWESGEFTDWNAEAEQLATVHGWNVGAFLGKTAADIKLVPEYWAQPGAVAYNYVNRTTRAVCNVALIDEQGALCWAINAWGATSTWYVDPDEFWNRYEEIEKPQSQYDAMAEVANKGREHCEYCDHPFMDEEQLRCIACGTPR